MKDRILNFVIIVCLCVIFVFGIIRPDLKNIETKIKNYTENHQQQKTDTSKPAIRYNNMTYPDDASHPSQYKREIPVNPPVELSYKSKDYVYTLRKKYVSKSIFANPDYNPSEAVFGQIVDYKPWYSVNYCPNEDGKPKVDGASEESRFINNPSMLVAIEYPYYKPRTNQEKCLKPINQMIPKKIEYVKSKKKIIVTYYFLPFLLSKNNIDYYTFNGINARDFGFNYIYIDKNKTSLKMQMRERDNVTNSVVEFRNFIHLGYSCKVEGGCNNGSPMQPALDFKYTKSEYQNRIKHPQIYIKLWKNRPASFDDEPDMIEVIKFIHDL